jgi:hypothetical protein
LLGKFNSSTFNNEKLFMEEDSKLKSAFKGEPFDDVISYMISEEFRNKLIKLLEELRLPLFSHHLRNPPAPSPLQLKQNLPRGT